MRRRLARISTCFILGAVTTVAVAWALALTIPLSDWRASRMLHVGTERPRWAVRTFRDLGTLDIHAAAVSGVVWRKDIDERPMPRWSRTGHPPTADEVEGDTLLYEEARGWPMLSLYRRETDALDFASTWRTEWAWEFKSARRFTKNRESLFVPLGVIWPGFFIDTLFYGILWFGLLFGFSAARRGLRKKRGLCPMCAYDLRGCPDGSRTSPRGCPECGWNRSDDQPPGEAGG